jgi:BlaI family transcriptional regulator, penicillinase repressor
VAQEPSSSLGRRERQIMEVVYRLGQVTVADVLAELPDPPSYSSVRAMMRYLEDKGHLRHDESGRRFVYRATARKQDVRGSALASVVRTFFDGSASSAVATLLSSKSLSDDDYRRLFRLLEQARAGEDEK